MSESTSLRDLIRDELAGWPIASGYYSTAVSVDDARDMADAVLAVLADPPADVFERALDMFRNRVLKCRCSLCESIAEERVKDTFAAVFGGESS